MGKKDLNSGLRRPCIPCVIAHSAFPSLVTRKQSDWQTAIELTDSLKGFDANDPVKYDFALFGLGVFEKF